MNNVDSTWARDQLRETRTRIVVSDAVLRLLQAWEDIESADVETTEEILNTFKSLAQGHSLLPVASDEIWVEAKAGFLRVADIVRIRHDAFSDASGMYHNGRIGKVIALRSGDVVFRSTDDKKPFIDGAHYSPSKLEKRVR